MRWICVLFMLMACKEKADDTPESDADTDADADTDTDTDTDTDSDVAFRIWSPDHVSSAGQPGEEDCENWLPDEFTCGNPNPEIAWEGVPAEATHLVLIFDDPDAGNFPHWAIWNIPATEEGLAAAISGETIPNMPPGGALEAVNGFGFEGYLGSCPGSIHQYRWRLWAVDATLDTVPGGQPSAVYNAVRQFALDNQVGSVARMCHLRGPPP